MMIVKYAPVSLMSLLLLGVPAFAGTAVPQPANAPPGSTANSNHLDFNNNNTDGNNATDNANNGPKQTAEDIVKNASTTIDRVKSDEKFADLLKQAKGVFIVPNVVKGAAVVGGEGGRGVLLAREDGHWSDPAFLSMGSISIGAQVGGEVGSIVMVLMTDKAMNDFTSNSNFSLNANADLTIVNYSAKAQGGFGKGDVIIWSDTHGGLIGASISGSDVSADHNLDDAFYDQKNLTTEKIVKGNMESAAANHLVNEMPS